MKTWTLVWFLVFPPQAGDTEVTWNLLQQSDLTNSQCFELLVEKDVELRTLTEDRKLAGYEVYCKEDKNETT
jgi:hypothetical protein